MWIKKKKRYRYIFDFVLANIFLLYIPLVLYAQTENNIKENTQTHTYSGKILNQDLPVAFATMIIKELDEVGLSEEDGSFTFFDIAEGTYTLLIVADGFEDKEFPIVVPEIETQRTFQIGDVSSDEVFQSESIIITAERFKNSSSGKKTFTREEVDALPLQGDDPTSIIMGDTGVVGANSGDDIGNPPSGSNTKGQLYSTTREYSLYGGDTGWNRYFYGNIQIPTNLHISNPATSVITRKAVETVTNYKALPGGVYGQGLGGTVIMTPRKDKEEFLLIEVSPTDPSLTFNYWLTNRINFFVSARYSLAEYTVMPLINYIVDNFFENTDIKISEYKYADAVLSFSYESDMHKLALVSLGFYDVNVVDVNINEPAQGNADATRLEGKINSSPIYGAIGLSWEALVGDVGKNTMASYISIYNSTSDSGVLFETEIGNNTVDTEGYFYKGFINSLDTRLIDYYERFLTDNSSITLGMELQYLQIKGTHSDYFNKTTENLNQDINSTVTDYSVKEDIFKMYGFLEYSHNFNKLETVFTAGAAQVFEEYTDYTRTFPSGKIFTNYNFSKDWKLSFTASISPSFLEGSKYADRLLSEEMVSYPAEKRTSYIKPTYGIVTLPKLTWQITEMHTLFLEPFFGYYYNFSGLHPNLSVDNVEDAERGYIYITPTQGISTGSSILWEWNPTYYSLSASYTLSFAMYDTDEYGWIHPNTDYRHQLKFQYSYKRIKQFQIGITGNVLFDVAFTPTEIGRNLDEDVSNNNIHVDKKAGDPFSARSYIPSYELFLNIKGTIIEKKKWDFTYRVQPGNILSMFRISGNDIKNLYDGATSKDVDNRTLEFEFAPYLILQGLLLSFQISISL